MTLPVRDEPFFLGHPRGLFVLFFTEMWERMSYYGMRALLVLYMSDYLFVGTRAQTVVGLADVNGMLGRNGSTIDPDALGSTVYGWYTGFVYLTPFFGGLLADRVLGRRRSIVLGGVLMMIGHFLMASEKLFFLALFVLVLGNGAFKPNISAQVGQLYPEGDPRRDGAFTLFYMGINVGGFIAPFICGTLGQRYGWHYGFAAAGVGMALGLVIYLASAKYLPADIYGRTHQASAPEDSAIDVRTLALVGVSVLSLFFWAAFEQQGNTLQIWADRRTDLDVLGFSIPSTWYQSLNPFFVIALAPLLDRLWARQRKGGTEPSTVSKMAIGCFLLSGGYVVMLTAASVVPDGVRASVLWLFFATLLLTLGELYVSPVGLSLISRKAPVRLVGTLMGVWFGATFLGNVLGGYVGSLAAEIGHYRLFFVLLAVSVLPGVLLLLLRAPLERGLVDAAVPASSPSGVDEG